MAEPSLDERRQREQRLKRTVERLIPNETVGGGQSAPEVLLATLGELESFRAQVSDLGGVSMTVAPVQFGALFNKMKVTNATLAADAAEWTFEGILILRNDFSSDRWTLRFAS